MDGFINFLKPPGMTSHDVVGFIRKKLHMKKVGHTGTLDPDVAGILIIALGKATRLSEYVLNYPKSYRCEMILGIKSDTEDLSGNITYTCEPEKEHLHKFQEIFSSFEGEIEQIPPMYSAVRIEGKRLYEIAREGKEIERKPRKVNIYNLNLIKTDFDSPIKKALFDVTCSKGTYIRTLCTDIGTKLGCDATMSYLVRTKYGPYHINNSWTIEDFEAACFKGDFSFILPMETALMDIPRVYPQDAKSTELVQNGLMLALDRFEKDEFKLEENKDIAVYNKNNKLMALANLVFIENKAHVKLKKVFKD